MTTWHKGPPPSVGWWPASRQRDKKALRWWNGKVWSVVCYSHFHANVVAKRAATATEPQIGIKWTERPASWPKRSRT